MTPILQNFSSEAFLRDHWQKRPLLIRGAWPSWRNSLHPDELAGLACEPGIESRLIVRKRKAWKVEHGPLPEKRFRKLGKHPWTLLVQAVDHLVPEVAALRDAFAFIPNWRIDDVMVSYASDGGGVGAHFDQYDVFLLQGLGQRRWQVGQPCNATAELMPHDDLRLLANFEPTEEWLLDPGDILYVPPGIAHHGVAVGDDCMTYSIGCRAPSRSELIAHWCDHLLDTLPEDDRYADPGLAVQPNPGEIASAALARLHAMITETLADRDAFARWFGQYTTTPKHSGPDEQPEAPAVADEMRERLASGTPLTRNPASRFSFIRQSPSSLLLFVDGDCFECAGEAAAFAERLCAADRLAARDGTSAADLIAKLVDRGSLAFGDDG